MAEKKYVCVELIDDDDDMKNVETVNPEVVTEVVAKKKKRSTVCCLAKFLNDDATIEIGADEAGRGPMFGRVYSAAVVLPKDDSFDHSKMKDSKKFHSKKKIEDAATYIKNNAIAWSVKYADEAKIDEINILQATQMAMHDAINDVRAQLHKSGVWNGETKELTLLIDGNYFNRMTNFNKKSGKIEVIPYKMIEGGDNKYSSIAAASILAKVERDAYIEELCKENPELVEHYGIDSNKGYGSKKHMDGIKEHGITKWHRRSFGICKTFA